MAANLSRFGPAAAAGAPAMAANLSRLGAGATVAALVLPPPPPAAMAANLSRLGAGLATVATVGVDDADDCCDAARAENLSLRGGPEPDMVVFVDDDEELSSQRNSGRPACFGEEVLEEIQEI